MDQPVLIIGSNSFSGAHYVDYCLKNSEARVLGISRSAEPPYAYLPYKWSSERERFEFHQFDLNRHLDAIVRLVEEARPGWIVNFAAQGMVAQSWDHPGDWFRTNTLGHVLLHDRLREFDFIRKYVQVSTPEVYGNTASRISEDAPLNPSSPYAVSKAACDMSLKTFHTRYRFPVVFTRAANVYGPGQHLYRIVPRTIIGVHTGRKLELHGGGHSVRSFIHIRDVCEATFRIMQDAEPPNVYHLTTGDFCSVRALVETILERMGVRFEEHVEMTADAPGRDLAYTLRADRAEKEFGWTASTPLPAGIAETVDWVERFKDFLVNEPLHYVHRP